MLKVKYTFEKFSIAETAEEFMGKSLLGRKSRVDTVCFFSWSPEPAARPINFSQGPGPGLDPGSVGMGYLVCRLQRRRQTHEQGRTVACGSGMLCKSGWASCCNK